MKQKNSKDKNIATPIIVLTVIVIVSVSLMILVNNVVSPKIESQKKALKDEKTRSIFPEADSFIERGDMLEIYDDDQLIGFVVEGSVYGYSSDIQFMVGLDDDLKIRSVSVLSQAETPGLGSKIQSDEFLQQFAGKTYEQINLIKDGGEIDAISGATISSQALTEGIRKSISELDG